MGEIRKYLNRLGLTSDATTEEFAHRTRDANLTVYRDTASDVIFIDDYYVGDEVYLSSDYRGHERLPLEDSADTERRIVSHAPLIFDRSILDFGFGDGSFLLRAKDIAKSAVGVELEQRAAAFSEQNGVPVFRSLQDVEMPIDTIFAFHVVEHLERPWEFLEAARRILARPGGYLVVEVPHSRDFLLSTLQLEAFKAFTLWSQHLILHSRHSLRLALADAGFEVLSINGVQRYGLGNHIGWLHHGSPGLHKTPPYSHFNSASLGQEYSSVLGALDCNDTLVAIARPAS